MLPSMQRIALVLGCLVWTSQGRRVQTAGERMQSGPPSEKEAPRSSRQAQVPDTLSTSSALARLLSASQPSQAFSAPAQAVQPLRGQPTAAASQLAAVHAQGQSGHGSPVMRIGEGIDQMGDPLRVMSKKDLRELATEIAGVATEDAQDMSLNQLRKTIGTVKDTGAQRRSEDYGVWGKSGKSQKDIDREVRALPSKDDFWGLPEGLSIALENSGIVRLNDMQRMAVSYALKGRDVIVHGETGSGKTLCYVLPILAKHSWHDTGLQSIVITPTLELASQVAHVFNLLRPETAEAMTMDMEEPPDTPVLIGPPRMLLEWIKGDRAPLSVEKLQSVKSVVIDEADLLLKAKSRHACLKESRLRERHLPEAELLCGHISAVKGGDVQVFAVSATLGRPVRRLISNLFGQETRMGIDQRNFEVIRGNSKGNIFSEEECVTERKVALPANVSVSVVTTHHEDLLTAVHEVLAHEEAKAPLFFIPDGRSIMKEIELLRNSGINAVSMAEAIIDRSADAGASLAAPEVQQNSGQLLVTSPGSGRGLDVHGIDLVILMGSPANTDAFLHMAGRTGRQGAKGRVVILTTRKDAETKLAVIGSHLGIDFKEGHRHLDIRDSALVEMWSDHSKRYGGDSPEKFKVQMEGKAAKLSPKEMREKNARDARQAAMVKQSVLGAKAFKKSLSRKAKKRVNRKKREAEWRVREMMGEVPEWQERELVDA
mmetsp:Transcript_109295/g.193527  ORF Transcript_109295/g.193527 Transcript_109295/m.193527 type:complete len:713 (+) Transcript_109295:41-2179(+)